MTDAEPISTGLILSAIKTNNFANVEISIGVMWEFNEEQTLSTIFQPTTPPLSLSHFLTTNLDTCQISPGDYTVVYSTSNNIHRLELLLFDFLGVNTELQDVAFPNLQTICLLGLNTYETNDDVRVAQELLEHFSDQIRCVEIKNSKSFNDILKFIFQTSGTRKRGNWNLPVLKELALLDCKLDPSKLASGVARRARYSKTEGPDHRCDVSEFALRLEGCSMTQEAFATMSKWTVEGGLMWDCKTKSLIKLDPRFIDDDEDMDDESEVSDGDQITNGDDGDGESGDDEVP